MEKIIQANQFIKEHKAQVKPEYRLNYHLMGEHGWINDPNGFIHFGGVYHLFYQYNPYRPVWGDVHWGHAVSRDLVAWRQLPVALAPDCSYDRDGCFSGSALEINNRLYLMYTGFVYTGPNKTKDYRQTQCLAYSDDGLVFKKWRNNPVIGTEQIPEGASKRDFRDPKLIRRGEAYYAFIGSKDRCGQGQVLLYKSRDLLNWHYRNVVAKSNGRMGGMWECPDFFQLGGHDFLLISPQFTRESGDQNLTMPIYFTGQMDFAKGTFTSLDYDSLDYGFDFYAPQTVLDQAGRRIMVAWMNRWETIEATPTLGHNWVGAMTLPREITAKEGRLFFKPIKGIEKYRRNQFTLRNITLTGEKVLTATGCCYELIVCFVPGKAEEFGLKLRVGATEETVISYIRDQQGLIFNRNRSGAGPPGERKIPVKLLDDKLKLRVFVDQSSVELFINEGEKVATGRIYPGQGSDGIKLFARGECIVESLEKWDLVVSN